MNADYIGYRYFQKIFIPIYCQYTRRNRYRIWMQNILDTDICKRNLYLYIVNIHEEIDTGTVYVCRLYRIPIFEKEMYTYIYCQYTRRNRYRIWMQNIWDTDICKYICKSKYPFIHVSIHLYLYTYVVWVHMYRTKRYPYSC